eukprot:SAG11_NODE_829_length_6967_cov_7.039196_8_plen_114_part_00
MGCVRPPAHQSGLCGCNHACTVPIYAYGWMPHWWAYIYIYVYIKTGVSECDRDSWASCALCVMTSCVPYLRYWSLMDINGFSTHGSGISGSMRLMRYDDMSAVPVLDRRRVIL